MTTERKEFNRNLAIYLTVGGYTPACKGNSYSMSTGSIGCGMTVKIDFDNISKVTKTGRTVYYPTYAVEITSWDCNRTPEEQTEVFTTEYPREVLARIAGTLV